MEKARDAMRRHVGYYASTPAYRPVLDLHGWGDLQTELYACSKKGRWDGHGPPRRRRGARHADHRLRAGRAGRRGGRRYGGLVDRINVSWWRKEWWPDVEKELRAL